MLEQILIYLNARLKTLFPDFTVLGLCEKVEETEKDETISFPAEYCANNEYKPIDIDNHKGLFYWRKNGTVNIAFIEDEFSDDEMEQRTYPMRGVLFAPKDYYKTDNNYIEEKFADNIKKKMVFDGDKNFRIALKATDAEFNISRYETNRNNVIAEEFEGVKPKVPFDWVAMAFDYDIIITGNSDCWDYWGCLDEPADIPLGYVKIVNQSGQIIAEPICGSIYEVMQFSGIQDSGAPYSNSIVDNTL